MEIQDELVTVNIEGLGKTFYDDVIDVLTKVRDGVKLCDADKAKAQMVLAVLEG